MIHNFFCGRRLAGLCCMCMYIFCLFAAKLDALSVWTQNLKTIIEYMIELTKTVFRLMHYAF